MDAKAMDAEDGGFNEDVKNLVEAIDAEGNNLGDKNSLKRPADAIDDDDDDDEDKYSHDSAVSDEDLICWSDIRQIFGHANFKSVSLRLEGEVLLVKLFENILKILKRENISSGDADEFTNVVKQVFANDAFVAELYKEIEDPWCHSMIGYCARRTQDRVGKETNEERMALIKSDTHFAHASAGGNNELIVRGGLSIIIAYCVAEKELTEIFTRCRDDEQLRTKSASPRSSLATLHMLVLTVCDIGNWFHIFNVPT